MRISPTNIRHHSYRGSQGQFQQQRRSANLSPMSGNRSPNSGGSSAYHDRLVTIRLVCPCSNSVVCTRLSRVVQTLAKGQNGAAVCEDYMYTQTCPLGETCPKVHVAQEHTWSYITQDINKSTGLYEPGFTVQCYDPRMTRYYTIPSDFVLPTRGSNEYVRMHNEHGDNFKTKFKLCEAMTLQGKCDLGVTCEDVHTIFEDLTQVESNTTHVTDPDMLMQYPRLRPDITVRVFEQNSIDSYVDFSGDQVLMTLGARQYSTAFDAEGKIPKKKMQHCAHFRTKNLCRMGKNCRFLHVVADFGTLAGSSPIDGVSPYSISRGDSPASDINVNVRSRHGLNGSRVAVMVAQKYGVGGAESNPLNLVHGSRGDLVLNSANTTTSTTTDNNNNINNNNNGFAAREDQYMPVEAAPTPAPPRGVFSTQMPADGGGRMRMISPTRRNNPYAMYPVESVISPQQSGE